MAIFRTRTRTQTQTQLLQLIISPLSLLCSSHHSLSLSINMNRKFRTLILFIFTSIIFFEFFCLYIYRDVKVRLVPLSNNPRTRNLAATSEQVENHHLTSISSSQVSYSPSIRKPEAVLLPDWEVLLIDSPSDDSLSSYSGDHFLCFFENNSTSPAKLAGNLPFSHRFTFKCSIPNSLRRRRRHRLRAPILTKSVEIQPGSVSEMLRYYGFLAYDSMSTANDVILFVKGVNTRQGVNRSPDHLTCVFDNGDNFAVKTAVIASSQEVFRCHHPNMSSLSRLFLNGDEKVKISIEVGENGRVIVPSVAYYSLPRSVAEDKKKKKKKKSVLCACTMVHNVGKFLKEWVMYNSEIGVEKFILYDNDSQDDQLQKVVEELVEEEDYNVETLFWPWPKTQEAGFSHCAMHAMESCTWMMYMDVDEFVYSPSWLNSTRPSSHMLRSLLLSNISSSLSLSLKSRPIGQISIRCLEFGPSNQSKHPVSGVTQGYTCRRQIEQRHKSIVLLNAIDTSLGNAIHHFQLKQGYRGVTLSLHKGLVNHYKYQAWSEFKAKFRRRVSAYVVDWRKEVNPHSKDRTPGLGFEPVEPEGWANWFCEVHDARLKIATSRWFGLNESSGYRLAWQ